MNKIILLCLFVIATCQASPVSLKDHYLCRYPDYGYGFTIHRVIRKDFDTSKHCDYPFVLNPYHYYDWQQFTPTRIVLPELPRPELPVMTPPVTHLLPPTVIVEKPRWQVIVPPKFVMPPTKVVLPPKVIMLPPKVVPLPPRVVPLPPKVVILPPKVVVEPPKLIPEVTPEMPCVLCDKPVPEPPKETLEPPKPETPKETPEPLCKSCIIPYTDEPIETEAEPIKIVHMPELDKHFLPDFK